MPAPACSSMNSFLLRPARVRARRELESPEHRRGRYDHASIRGILDNDGVRLGEYLTELRAIPPMGSATYVVSQSDRAGGIGANFLVEWRAEEPVQEPVIEAVMFGVVGNHAFSFRSPGRVIERH